MSQESTEELRPYTDEDMPIALRVSEGLRRIVDFVGKAASWAIVPLVVVTCFDVLIRKLTWRNEEGGIIFGVQYYLVNNVSEWFGSTLLQESEWHLHTILFALVLAYGYIYNTHVRVDLVRETLAFRKKAWIEFIGITIFLIPFVAIATYFSVDYAYTSYLQGEISASQVGLPHRFLIKSVLVVGLILVLMAGFAVWLQAFMVLFGDPSRRYSLMTLEWPEEEGTMIEGKKRIELEDSAPVAPTRGTGAVEPT